MNSIAASRSSNEWRALRSDWPLLQSLRFNVLLIGTMEQVSDCIVDVWPTLQEPVDLCEARSFRQPSAPAGTLILQNASGMPVAHQIALLAWLRNAEHATHVITTVTRPLFPDLQVGLFLDSLYLPSQYDHDRSQFTVVVQAFRPAVTRP